MPSVSRYDMISSPDRRAADTDTGAPVRVSDAAALSPYSEPADADVYFVFFGFCFDGLEMKMFNCVLVVGRRSVRDIE